MHRIAAALVAAGSIVASASPVIADEPAPAAPAADAGAPPAGATVAPKPAADAALDAVNAKLDGLKVTLDFTDTPLEDAVDFIREFSGLNILIDESVRERYAKDPVKISLRVKNLPLRSALNLILEPRKMTLTWQDGVLLIVTNDKMNSAVLTQIYDVRDLLMPVRDFPGPEVSLAPLADATKGTDIQIPADEGGGLTGDFIVSAVKTHCGKSTWDTPRASAEIHNGLLIVTQSVAVHRQVRELLGKLRESK